jgi:hypothetical protein
VDPNHSIVLEGIEAKRKPEDPPFDHDTIRDFVMYYELTHCLDCGGTKPHDRSCICVDNGCE